MQCHFTPQGGRALLVIKFFHAADEHECAHTYTQDHIHTHTQSVICSSLNLTDQWPPGKYAVMLCHLLTVIPDYVQWQQRAFLLLTRSVYVTSHIKSLYPLICSSTRLLGETSESL